MTCAVFAKWSLNHLSLIFLFSLVVTFCPSGSIFCAVYAYLSTSRIWNKPSRVLQIGTHMNHMSCQKRSKLHMIRPVGKDRPDILVRDKAKSNKQCRHCTLQTFFLVMLMWWVGKEAEKIWSKLEHSGNPSKHMPTYAYMIIPVVVRCLGPVSIKTRWDAHQKSPWDYWNDLVSKCFRKLEERLEYLLI